MSEEKSAADVASDANIEIWKIKKLIKSLEAARGCALALYHEPAKTQCACVGCRGRRSIAAAVCLLGTGLHDLERHLL